jgi:acetyl esterase/lipase
MTLAVFSHILHPRSDVPSVSLGDQKFAGAVLVSPWVTFDQTAPAFKNNASKDILSGPVLKRWSDAFMGKAARDNYTYPLDASPEWWQGLPVEETLVLTGGDEVFVDDIKVFADKLKVSYHRFCSRERWRTLTPITQTYNAKVELLVSEGECHDSPLIEGMTAAAPGKVTKKFYDWTLTHI